MKIKVHFTIKELPVSLQEDVEVSDMDDSTIKKALNTVLAEAFRKGVLHRELHVGHVFFTEQLT